MANYFVNLPAPKIPGNAILDLTSINSGLDDIRNQKNLDRQRADMLDERNYQRGREAVVDQRAQIDWFSKQAAAIDQMQGPQRQAAWQAYLAKHPNAASLGPEYHDPINGPKIVAAEAGRFNDPLDKQIKLAQVQGANTSNALHAQQLRHQQEIGPLQVEQLKAQTQKLREGDPMQRLLMDVLRGTGAAPGAAMSPSPSQPGPRLIPQSAPGQMPQPGLQNVADVGSDPNLIRTQSAQPQAQQVPMVNTPLGPMPQDKARAVGMAFALGGKGEAGKMMAESPNQFGKEGMNDIDKQIIGRMTDLADLEDIRAGFKPEFQSLGGKLKATGSSWQSYVQGGLTDPAQKASLQAFVEHRSLTTERLNNRIKLMSGTAVSGKEEERMYKANPNAGTGILDGDDPDTFQAKTDTQIRMHKAAIMRYSWLRSQGASPEKIAELAKTGKIEGIARLEDIPKLYTKRGQEIEGLLRQSNPGVPEDQLRGAVKQRLRQEFGI